MKYNKLEDKAIHILHGHMSGLDLRPQWGKIVNLMNSHRAALNASKELDDHAYTVSMVRNRHQRITKSADKRKRNRCGACGLLLRGHTCGVGEDDTDDVVYNLLGIKPTKEQHGENLPAVSNDACVWSPVTSDMLNSDDRELHALFELFQSYDEAPDPIEKYQLVWDSME